MIQSPIPKALSTFLKCKVQSLLMGGQACILYGAAEFSRDIDLAVMVSHHNLENLKSALVALEAERIYVPDLSEEALLKGHACHFRCQKGDAGGLRIDILGVMRGVDSFPKLWERREEICLPGIGTVAVMGLADLVKAKKTQRDRDWPMIRRLLETDIYRTSGKPSMEKVSFWLAECRTPEILTSLASEYKNLASIISVSRPLLISAIEGNQAEVQRLLRDEEDREKELDRQYWTPLRLELEAWLHGKD